MRRSVMKTENVGFEHANIIYKGGPAILLRSIPRDTVEHSPKSPNSFFSKPTQPKHRVSLPYFISGIVHY
jgi:hypothetical protein